MSCMDQEESLKKWFTAAVFEYSCRNNFVPVIKKILCDDELLSSLSTNFTFNLQDRENVKPIFVLIFILQRLLSAVETFSSDAAVDYPWNSDGLHSILKLLEKTYEKCEFISLKKFFSLVTQLKFLDLLHLLRLKVEPSVLMQKLNLHFPRWQANQKENLVKQFTIENPKILDKVDESYTQCRRLMLKLAADSSYRNQYMSQQFLNDMNKIMIESIAHLKEVIHNLLSNAGETVIDKRFLQLQTSNDSEDLAYQLFLDYLKPEASSETLLRFLDEMESVFSPPTGGFSSCLLPFDTMSECSDIAMDMDTDDSESETSSEENSDEKDKTLRQEECS